MYQLSKQSREIVQQFEGNWHSNPPADLIKFVRDNSTLVKRDERSKVLLRLIQVDFEMRSKASFRNGETVAYLNDYVRHFADELSDHEIPDELVVADFQVRRVEGGTPNLSELARPFVDPQKIKDIETRILSAGQDELDELPEIEGFIIRQRIGQGGMGTVYSAFDIQLDRDVAVKLVSSKKVSPEFIERFEREAQILAKLDSEHFLPIFRVGVAVQPSGVPYYSMRLIKGARGESTPKTLSDLCREKEFQTTDISQRLTLFKRIVDIVALAHSQPNPILHRDLKPANILIDSNHQAWVIDWGLAKLQHVEPTTSASKPVSPRLEATSFGQILGTPPYMAPEPGFGQSK